LKKLSVLKSIEKVNFPDGKLPCFLSFFQHKSMPLSLKTFRFYFAPAAPKKPEFGVFRGTIKNEILLFE